MPEFVHMLYLIVSSLVLSPAVSLGSAPSGSSLSLASAATEGDSVASGGASSHR